MVPEVEEDKGETRGKRTWKQHDSFQPKRDQEKANKPFEIREAVG
jgi:hypothetical protein